MKAKITITPKKAVLDPQGVAVRNALAHMGFNDFGEVHVGRYLEIEIASEDGSIQSKLEEACRKFLSNPVIEDFQVELV